MRVSVLIQQRQRLDKPPGTILLIESAAFAQEKRAKGSTWDIKGVWRVHFLVHQGVIVVLPHRNCQWVSVFRSVFLRPTTNNKSHQHQPLFFSVIFLFSQQPSSSQLAALSFPTPFGLHSFLHEQLAWHLQGSFLKQCFECCYWSLLSVSSFMIGYKYQKTVSVVPLNFHSTLLYSKQ
jgi:hypothetical protein